MDALAEDQPHGRSHLKEPTVGGRVVELDKAGVKENLRLLNQTLETIKERESRLREARRHAEALQQRQNEDKQLAETLRSVVSQLSGYVYKKVNDNRIDEEARKIK